MDNPNYIELSDQEVKVLYGLLLEAPLLGSPQAHAAPEEMESLKLKLNRVWRAIPMEGPMLGEGPNGEAIWMGPR